jgi:hypothetical protein
VFSNGSINQTSSFVECNNATDILPRTSRPVERRNVKVSCLASPLRNSGAIAQNKETAIFRRDQILLNFCKTHKRLKLASHAFAEPFWSNYSETRQKLFSQKFAVISFAFAVHSLQTMPMIQSSQSLQRCRMELVKTAVAFYFLMIAAFLNFFLLTVIHDIVPGEVFSLLRCWSDEF